MTLTVVVACKDNFYMIADTRTEDIAKQMTTDNTKKIFYSTKHQLGLCIADDSMLPDPSDPKNLDKTLSVSFLMDEFFKGIEQEQETQVKIRIGSVEAFFKDIQLFIQNKFGNGYLAVFQKNVSVFLAGIINNQTVIASYHGKQGNKQFDTFCYATDFQNKLCAFSNYQNLIDDYSQQVVTHNSCPIIANSNIEKQNILFSEPNMQYRQAVFNSVFCSTRAAVLQQHPHSIGEYLDYAKVGKNISELRAIQFAVSENKLVQTTQFPPYIIPKTEKEFDDFVRSGKIITRDYQGWPIPSIENMNKQFGSGYGF